MSALFKYKCVVPSPHALICYKTSIEIPTASLSCSVTWASNMVGLKRQDLVDLSSEDLASKLNEAGLPKTLTRALEGKDCHS